MKRLMISETGDEFYSYTLPILDDFGIQKCNKSALYNTFTSTEQENLQWFVHVINKRYFLNRVVWSRSQSFS